VKLRERLVIMTPSASIPAKSSPTAVSPDRRDRRVIAPIPPIMIAAPTAAPSTAGNPASTAISDAREHTVGQRIGDERQPAQHDERSDHRADRGDDQARTERVTHEGVVGEGRDQQVDHEERVSDSARRECGWRVR
jgi:hypothetical protein